MSQLFLISGALFAGLSVILGAFAAHGLKSRLSEYAIGVFQTGVEYQMYHALGLILLGILAKFGVNLTISGYFMIAGIVLFSGSLYALALTNIKWFGPITPIGGLCFIIAWAAMIIKLLQMK
ncbi:DUF423 domain-containing protein [Pseudoalteromonas sp. CNC9-20]|uniref:DUF423 domain-containing protein n=1 Tax=Pseudoalteromonas sp. CNC9-20 TaxID=2917750 RepID=UPI001EF64D34|nr:DUF423 domain-containing protein [Pseudoalteromonas sp. CNC9-20]MCG7571114.1 DUF423 domain-containing protein [Pseudoalteromonas sp. CNC9-20]